MCTDSSNSARSPRNSAACRPSRRRFHLREGEIHALARRERRRQVDADQDHRRRLRATSGEILLDGKAVRFANPAEALRNGIAMVFQETSLVPSMTVAQNIYLGEEKLLQPPARHLHRGAAVPAVAEFDVDPTALVSSLGAAQEADGRDRPRRAPQRPGHHLRRADSDADAGGEASFLRADRRLKQRGVSIIFITHALEEALQICGPHHDAARRRARGHRRRRATSTARRSSGPWSGATLSNELYGAAPDGAAGRAGERSVASRTCRWADGAQHVLLDLSPGRSPASSAWSAPAAPRPRRSSPAC